MLKLVEMFHTFQGEGQNWGRRAFFVRMPFCNLNCSWCDTQFNKFEKYSLEDFKAAAVAETHRFAVITGGEPTMNTQTPLVIEVLERLGYEIAIETNGCFPIPEGIDFITVSPKRDSGYEIHPDAAAKCDELKVVVDDEFDFAVAAELETQVRKGARLTLSPEFGELEKNFAKIQEYIQENPQWRISLQSHKFLKIR